MKTIRDVNATGKRVFGRAGFDIRLNGHGQASDMTRRPPYSRSIALVHEKARNGFGDKKQFDNVRVLLHLLEEADLSGGPLCVR
jgi:hypothetical protein